MTELQISISNALGVNLEECQILSTHSLLAKIPLRVIDTQWTNTKSSKKTTEGDIVTVHVTSLRYDKVFAWNEDEGKLTETFSTTLSGLARKNGIQVFHNITSLNPTSDCRKVSEDVSNKLKRMKDEESCLTFLTAIFGIDIRSGENSFPQDTDTSTFANLRIPSKILSADHVIYLVHKLPDYTVADCLMYSPSLLTAGSVKTSFILFQVLQFFSAIERRYGGNLSSIHWNDIEVDSNGWIKVQLPEDCFVRHENREHPDEMEKKRGKLESLADYLDGWICGEVSNFDYLMFLNKLAGRDSDDPNHHPILPWVSTFDDEHSSWRDLTKSKYRLNKGDRQLDIQYAMMSDGMEKNGLSQLNLHQVPHHVPEYISDITYYVYMARRTPKSILCKLVRSYWEPNEYPSSIQRMQEWTPDECIPEFYTDPAVFKSLHEDMCDLLVPEWSKDPSDFVEKHRKMLESDTVSKKLHHWIDITFGYKLSGEHAKAEKNVCLPLVDNHTSMRKRGITQLFTAPHPQKGSKPGNFPQDLSKYIPEVLHDDNPIQLPKAFNPMRELDKVETLLKFKMSIWNDPGLSESLYDGDCLDFSRDLTSGTAAKKTSDSNMATFVCLMVELFLPLETRTLSLGFDIASRLKYCINVYKSNKLKFPAPFQSSMQYFISKLSTSDVNVLGMPTQRLFFHGHPAPTISLMSSRYIHVLPFPNYFHDLHNLLEIMMTRTNHNASPLPLKYLPLISEKLHCTLDDLGDVSDCLQILTPFLRQLIEQETMSAAAFVIANFEIISKTMGEKSTNSDLLPLVARLYEKILEENADKNELDNDVFDSAYLVAMYKKEFLLQLSVRVGLNGFLSHIPACLSNALIHKSICDIAETSKSSLIWLIDRIGPTLTSKYIIKHLFRVLSSCFMSANGVNFVGYGRVKCCLVRAAEIFGPSFITLQYFPFLSHRIASSVNHLKLTIRHQASIESSLVAISHLITYLSDNVLMVELKRIINEMLVPAMDLVGSQQICFPGGVDARKSLCMQVLHLMALVVVRIGREMSRKHMTSLFRTFFSYFQVNGDNRVLFSKSSSSDPSCESIDSDSVIIDHDANTQTFTIIENTKGGYRRVHKSWFSESPNASPGQESPILSSHRRSNAEAKAEIFSTFCAETAYRSYVSFTRLLGGIHMEKVLGDFHDQIHKLSLEYEQSLDDKSPMLEKQSPNSYHTDIMMVGNQLVVESPPARSILELENNLDFDIISKLLESAGGVQTEDCLGECARRTLNTVPASQLTENWLAYWEHEIGLPDTDKHIHFNQIELQSFSGHASAVRCIASHPTEDWFVSGSKDKTVKIWSVPENLDLRENKNSTSGSLNEKYVYRFHKKTVNYVGIFETEQFVISNDGNIHVWDPYSCQQITTFDNADVKSGFALVYTPASPSRFALTVTNEADLRVMDFRRKCLAHEYKIVVGTSMGIARAMCDTEGGNRIAVGFSTGSVSSLDLRMGNKLSIKPAHESDISAMVSISDKRYLTASSDQSIAIWENGQSNPVTVYKNIQEPVHTVQTFNDEILSGSFANRIYIHDTPKNRPEISDKPVFQKLRSDIFRGVLTSFCILPMKRQLLLASDAGSIKLLA